MKILTYEKQSDKFVETDRNKDGQWVVKDGNIVYGHYEPCWLAGYSEECKDSEVKQRVQDLESIKDAYGRKKYRNIQIH